MIKGLVAYDEDSQSDHEESVHPQRYKDSLNVRVFIAVFPSLFPCCLLLPVSVRAMRRKPVLTQPRKVCAPLELNTHRNALDGTNLRVSRHTFPPVE